VISSRIQRLSRAKVRPQPGSSGEGRCSPCRTTLLEGATMAILTFSPVIQQHVTCPPLTVFGDTVKEILDVYFEKHRRLRSYLLDERGRLRPLLAVFIDGVPAQDHTRLSDPVPTNAQVFVFAQLQCHGTD